MEDKRKSLNAWAISFILLVLVLLVFFAFKVRIWTQPEKTPTSQIVAQGIPLTEGGEKVKKEHPDWPNDICNAVAEKDVIFGMTREQVVAAWGEPFKISTEMNAYQTREEWIMQDSPDSVHLYFDNGVVVARQPL